MAGDKAEGSAAHSHGAEFTLEGPARPRTPDAVFEKGRDPVRSRKGRHQDDQKPKPGTWREFWALECPEDEPNGKGDPNVGDRGKEVVSPGSAMACDAEKDRSV